MPQLTPPLLAAAQPLPDNLPRAELRRPPSASWSNTSGDVVVGTYVSPDHGLTTPRTIYIPNAVAPDPAAAANGLAIAGQDLASAVGSAQALAGVDTLTLPGTVAGEAHTAQAVLRTKGGYYMIAPALQKVDGARQPLDFYWDVAAADGRYAFGPKVVAIVGPHDAVLAPGLSLPAGT
jgi:hypothetical protein